MNAAPGDDEKLTPVKRALIEIRELRARLAEAEKSRHEPIAIVGMGLRFPGKVRDAESFAELLWSGKDAVTEIPSDRWSLEQLFSDDPDAAGKMITRHGAFLDDVDLFDADFFGISPREAESMDPQQRLVMEVAWEALENAGVSVAGLAGSNTGIYLGMANGDYGRALFASPEAIDAYFSTGSAFSVAAGRVSYFLNIHGPSITVDTACSSSLVALHLACQGLRLGECDLALAGGVNLILTPEMNINFSKARMMASDGRCKTFDAAADGYVRGEGCGMIVLRRLSDAEAHRDRILAVVRGSAMNQDGRSGGLTAPNGPAQEAVIRAALQAADVDPAGVSYVEAHGTGTPLGDPIEIGALGSTLCAGRDHQHPLTIGSVKTNFGHLEAAAGIASLIKVVLSLERKEIPPNLHFRTGNPHINWDDLPITVPTLPAPWQPIDGRYIAGVSSFGFSGTNAHVILEGAPTAQPTTNVADRPQHVLALSARDPASLGELAAQYRSTIAGHRSLADVCHTANAGRAHFAHRLAVVGATGEDMRSSLLALTAGKDSPGLCARGPDNSVQSQPQVAFLFTGQGAQHAGMGNLLYETSPTFRQAVDRCAEALAPYLVRDIRDVLFAPEAGSPINDTVYAQPATFVIEYALAELWRTWGIEPTAVLGHSLGEYAGACVAGILPLDDALRLVAKRASLSHSLPQEGAMAAVFADEDVVSAEVARSKGALGIGAYNGPEHFVISGDRSAVQTTVDRLEANGVRTKLLRVPHAAHSHMIDRLLPAFARELQTVQFGRERLAVVSNVTGSIAGVEQMGQADYWLRHMREPVRFAQSIQLLAERGITHFVEIGPHPVLLAIGAENTPVGNAQWLPSLRRDRSEWCDLLESLQRLYVDGYKVDWVGFDRDYERSRVPAPTYPFRRRRHWARSLGTSSTAHTQSANAALRVTSALERQADMGPLNLNVASYPGKWECLERLTSAHAIRTLREARLFNRSGEAHSLEDIMRAGGFGLKYRRLVRRWLDRLAASGLLRTEGEIYIAADPLPEPALQELWQETEARLADNQPLLAYLRHCGDLVGRVLTGDESPLETLFPGGSFDLAQNLYEHSSTMRYVNGLAAAAIEALAVAVPTGRMLRVLEVGAGTGGTTSSFLSVLPPDRVSYHFTDVSDFFIERARQRFASTSFVSYRRLDIDEDMAAQGFRSQSCDVVVAANAVHASINLPLALNRLRSLLAPGGTLILIESTRHLAWFDMSTGLIDGWQHSADAIRTDDPLLSPTQWLRALADAGFESADIWPRADSAASALGQHVLVARAKGVALHEAKASIEQVLQSVEAVQINPVVNEDLRGRLLETVPSERIDLLRTFVRDCVMKTLRRAADEVPDRHARLLELGLDSLMAVQLRNLLTKGLAFEKPLPATLMFDQPTIEALSTYLLNRLSAQEPEAEVETQVQSVNFPLVDAAKVASMSDADIEALLADRLGKH